MARAMIEGDFQLGPNPSAKRIVVAMSGGVDSSVVAALAHATGAETIGVTLQLYDHGEAVGRAGSCCAGRDIRDARAVCDRLGLTYVFKASFDKANRSSNASFRGPGLQDGLVVLERVKHEVGVPVLSKIPGLNRLFTNRSLVKDERTLLILVRPKIIIQKEIENGLFGPGYERPTGLPAGTPAPGVGAPGTAGFGIGATAR